ncbi:histidinol dehydrogenase [Liquorilactobacillus satsumensis]|uniref:Histidinol dehydrogenase n=1 Tax=Liquorilactobacillus satsumensis DSM 16230 = JCM 12392 TaxID=1423801 RepID=A0A0R1V4X0_9LACO|nr:histidinol dehydrogenase [Liquorilactobacillus satsumensis]KRM00576.1 bifunctional histidinal dehydrogenase histidinol dehydrogenase [Liquorilactobacillus satsumensis DSM 16230 = JCM 12392]MCC7667372.1 histidinol dehydrogenase [Liquorilactobacillus satsumensis]MCP9313231.1 histidinol dehydrogenase [Liquorilactobacillus satsumensis]MCP9358188.1 histidinol dehydrogenase [Liquorilactobacillus satsumensis]MCP9360408.1 histidinol dehydrogenase [Liquorilactobacillus satsumensis]
MRIYQESFTKMQEIVNDYTAQTTDFEIEQRVAEIIAKVRENGDEALKTYEEKFDHVKLAEFAVPKEKMVKALAEISPELKQALLLAKKNIISYHKRELEYGFIDTDVPGITRGQKVTPLQRVGLYVPGGTAAYPSTILMSALPAKIAGVSQIVMVTPPQKEGIAAPVLAAAQLAGVDTIYQVGGAQAIAALAYGTQSIQAVNKIVGPGNIYVATAKKQVFGQVAIDMVAGPSEIGILADNSAQPAQIAADLLSQAEHDKRARAILITDELDFAQKVDQEVEKQVKLLPRREIAAASIAERSFIAVMDSIPEMFALMNSVAPEHLEVQLKDPMQYLSLIQNAGSVFLGKYASEPLGDYVAGPNHILPTGGTAKFSSPLGVYDFVKKTSFIQFSQDALAQDLAAITTLARAEGLEAHARAVESRFKN